MHICLLMGQNGTELNCSSSEQCTMNNITWQRCSSGNAYRHIKKVEEEKCENETRLDTTQHNTTHERVQNDSATIWIQAQCCFVSNKLSRTGWLAQTLSHSRPLLHFHTIYFWSALARTHIHRHTNKRCKNHVLGFYKFPFFMRKWKSKFCFRVVSRLCVYVSGSGDTVRECVCFCFCVNVICLFLSFLI